MPAQYLTAWSPPAIIAAHTALVTVLSGGASTPKMTIHDSSDVLLATITLSDPVGTVNGSTGVLTITQAVRENSAPANGVASYASLRDGDNFVHRSVPCQQGTSPVAGYCVLNSLSIIAGSPVELVSLTVQ